jgi:hypothetical protein
MYIFLKQRAGVSSEALYILVESSRYWNEQYAPSGLTGIPRMGDTQRLQEIGYRIRPRCRVHRCERTSHHKIFPRLRNNNKAIPGSRIGIGH